LSASSRDAGTERLLDAVEAGEPEDGLHPDERVEAEAVPGRPRPPRAQLAVRWVGLAALVVVGTIIGEDLGVPSSAMLVGLLVGLVYAVRTSVPLQIDTRVSMGAQMVTGSAVGTYLSVDTIKGLGDAWLPVIVITLVTLVLTFGAGLLLARIADVSPATAAFGMIAGGAAGIVSIANDLGADDRMVAVMQYLRVVIILALTPVLAATLFTEGDGTAAVTQGVRHVGFVAGVLFVLCCGPLGVWLARRLHFTAPNFFGPLFIGSGLSLAGVSFAGQMPNLLPFIAFGIIGSKVGLDFTVETLKRARNILPAVLGVIVAMLVACAALGLIMAPLAGVSALDGYLATTPGVLQVVLATAIGMKANTTFVLSAQVVRLLMMLLAAPYVARRLIPMPVQPDPHLEPHGVT
jgi:membrane AbrB-like protein